MEARAPIMPKHITAATIKTHSTLRMSVILTKIKLIVKGLDGASLLRTSSNIAQGEALSANNYWQI